MGRRKTNFGESAWNNNFSWRMYFGRLQELAISTFEWENLPDTVDERYLELTLFYQGNAVFFEDKDLGYLALKCLNNGFLNVYNVPTKRRAFAVNGYQKALDETDSVIIWNNRMREPTVPLVEYYAKRLWEYDRIIDVNVRSQKTPVLIQGTENQRLTLMNLYKEFDGNAPVILADKALNVGDVLKVAKTDSPFVADQIYTLKTQLWNEAMTALGISNVSFQKKERLISDEVSRSMGGTIASRWSRLEARRKAAEEINKMFGLDIEVKFRDDFREMDDEFVVDLESGELTPQVIDLRTRGSVGGTKIGSEQVVRTR